MEFDCVVVRQNMLAELCGAGLWDSERNSEVIQTPPLTEFTPELLEKIRGKNVLIAGGYYNKSMKPILEAAKSVFVFYNSSDEPAREEHKFYQIEHADGFATWTANKVGIDASDFHFKIAKYLDDYQYGYPSEEALCFQNGVYVIDKSTDYEKLMSIGNIEQVIEAGRQKRISNMRIAEQRLKGALEFSVLVDKPCGALTAIGDSPIVDTCLLLAEKSKGGIGFLFRYDLAKNKTFISCRVNEQSGLDAGKIMQKLVGGGGSKPMGGGSIDGLIFPGEFFSERQLKS